MSRRKDYSIPDCPKIGRYDGLGMAAVPLAIADKERELGISHSSSSSYDYSHFGKDFTDAYNKGYKAGKKDGRKEGTKNGKIEVYKDIMKADNVEQLKPKAENFLRIYCPKYFR